MHILIIGGSGRTGQLVISQALSRGHEVTALVRNPNSLSPRDGLHIVTGSPLEPTSITKALTSTSPPTVVIVTLASTRTSESPFAAPNSPANLMADTHANIIAAAKEHEIRKVVTMGAMGVGDSFPNLVCFMRWLVRWSNLGVAFTDHDAVDVVMKGSGLDFVIVRPTRLTGGEARPVKTYGDEGEGLGGFAGVSRESVAGFLIDALERDTWDRSTPVIAN